MATSFVTVPAYTDNPLKLHTATTCDKPKTCVTAVEKKACAQPTAVNKHCADKKAKACETAVVEPCAEPCAADPCAKKERRQRRGVNGFWIWFIIFIILLIILVFTKPAIVVNVDVATEQIYVNWLALIFWSALFAAIIWGIIALIKRLAQRRKEAKAAEAACAAEKCAMPVVAC